MKLKRHGALLGTAALVLASTATLAGGGAASAAPPPYRTLTVSPSTSSTTDVNIEFDTNKQCPAPASNMIVRLYGTGMGTDGYNLMGNTGLSVVTNNGQGGKHPVAGITLKQAFQDNGVVSPSGAYDIKALCVNASATTTYAEFVGHLTFTATGTFEASWTSTVDASPGTETIVSPITGTPSYGDSVTLTATASSEDGPTTGGTIQFKDGGTNLGAPQAVSGSGVATYTTSALNAGSHSIMAQYLPGAAAFLGSTSTAQTFSISKANTSVSLASNAPSAQFEAATFTATVGPSGVAGTVQFTLDGANVGGARPVSGGVATFSSNTLAQATYVVGATFTPTNTTNYNGSTATTINHIVGPANRASETETVTAEVPTGGITITVTDDGVVDLGEAEMNAAGDLLIAEGDIDPIRVTDTRAGDPGWVADVVSSDFVNGASSVNAANLGITPARISTSANQVGWTLGSAVAAAAEATAGTTPTNTALGLYAPRTLFTTLNDAGNGTAELGGTITLQIPTDVPAGVYTATLTFTAI